MCQKFAPSPPLQLNNITQLKKSCCTYSELVRFQGESLDDDGLAPDGGASVPLLPIPIVSEYTKLLAKSV